MEGNSVIMWTSISTYSAVLTLSKERQLWRRRGRYSLLRENMQGGGESYMH
jgi:hypothetical protein